MIAGALAFGLVALLLGLSVLADRWLRARRARWREPARFVEGGHYLVGYTEPDRGIYSTAYLVVERLSEDGRALLGRIGTFRRPDGLGASSWIETSHFAILSVIRTPPALGAGDAGDARGSYRGE